MRFAPLPPGRPWFSTPARKFIFVGTVDWSGGDFFHPLFVQSIELAYQVAIPRIDSTLLIQKLKWSLSAALIFPQSILLGMTFPLMTAGIVRRFPETPGSTIAGLYYLNSLVRWSGRLPAVFFS